MASRVGRRWDRVGGEDRVNWWSSAKCQAHYNLAVCGEPLTGSSAGCRKRLAQAFPGRVFERAISVGCGAGSKEMAYLADGLVGGFDLWELATSRADAGKRAAQNLGLSERVRYQIGDAFAAPREPVYDLVHWDHSLHHMSDVEEALAWSVSVLRPGGVVLINDYIGPNRLQWTRAEVDFANAFLEQTDAPGPRVPYSSLLSRLKMWRKDPSEAPQSERILSACAKHLPGAEIAPIGGTLLNILGGIVIPNAPEESPVVDELVAADAKARDEGFSHFAFGVWSAP